MTMSAVVEARPDGGAKVAHGRAAAASESPLAPGSAARGAPPALLPGLHFAAALAFWVSGAAGLVWVAPDLAQGLFPLPRVVAVVYLFALGWITTSILGALYQFLPVALGTPMRWTRVAYVGLALYVPGLTLFVGGLIAAAHPAILAGAVLFSAGLLLFVANLCATLWRASQRSLTWWALAGAAVFLLVTVALGISLSANLRWGYLGADRFAAMGVHAHVAIAGWVMLVMVGVAQRLLPMFLLSHGAAEWPGRLAVSFLAAGAGLLVAFHFQPSMVQWWVVVLLIAGLLAFVLQAFLFFRHRRRPMLDGGLRLVAVAIAWLAVGVALGPAVVAQGVGAPRLAVAYMIALLLGGISLFVAGHYYKIVPFLAWYHRFGPLVGTRPVPRVSDLYAAGGANVAAILLFTGVAGLFTATLAPALWLARPAALIFAAGAAVVAGQMVLLALRRHA